MGTNFLSLHLKAADRAQVLSAVEASAEQVGGAAFVSHHRSGWIVAYPSMELLSADVLGQIAVESGASDLVAMSLYDGDVLCYWYFRDGELADSFVSSPDYFGEATDEDMAARGNAEAFAPILDAAGVKKLAKLIKARMINGESVGGEVPTFEDDRFVQIADVLGLQQAAGFYDSLTDEESTKELVDTGTLDHINHRG
jgi:hypothetical protein